MEMLLRIFISVVIFSKIFMIIIILDSGILCRRNVVNVVKSGFVSWIDEVEFILNLEMFLILIFDDNFYCK